MRSSSPLAFMCGSIYAAATNWCLLLLGLLLITSAESQIWHQLSCKEKIRKMDSRETILPVAEELDDQQLNSK